MSANVEPIQSPEQIPASPMWLKVYLWVVIVLLPMDWFAPTGQLLREFGARPATLVLTLGGVCGLAFLSVPRTSRNSTESLALLVFLAWFALGYLAALLNFMLGWSDWHARRDPLMQLATQSLLVMVCAIAVVGNARIMVAYPAAELVARYLPWAALLHLSIFAFEASGVLPSAAAVFAPFRASVPHEIRRPTGLFSEPSYFGTFAALYGTSLLFLEVGRFRKFLYALLAIALYGSAILIGAKTFVVVVGGQAAYFFLRRTRSIATGIAAVAILLAVVGCAIFFIQTYSALDVRSNLSSADRLGSALLAGNVAVHGYALPGIGFGQFHFFYRDRFAPDFLYLSREATLALSADAEDRASTYNFYLRVLVETGALGFLLLVVALRKLWNVELAGRLAYIPMIFSGTLGWLMTGDTYFAPPLVFSSALILAVMESRRRTVPDATAGGLARA